MLVHYAAPARYRERLGFFPWCYGMTSQWQPFREPLGATLARTGAIAVVLGAVLAGWRAAAGWRGGGGLARWRVATGLMLWPALGGHFVELWFLNWLRPRSEEHT